MTALSDQIVEVAAALRLLVAETSYSALASLALALCIVSLVSLYTLIYLVAPQPRPATPAEKRYRAIQPDGSTSPPRELPCWLDTWQRAPGTLEPAQQLLSVVVPAYNEAERLPGMLEEAVAFLESAYGSRTSDGLKKVNGAAAAQEDSDGDVESGWEIIVVSDGSRDATVQTALSFARERKQHSIRVVELERNRGKGGAVTHGLKHVRGRYALFADADGATKFDDLAKMLAKARELEAADAQGRAVVVGSRAHLVGSEAVVKRSLLRNALMYTFHLFIRLLTTQRTSQIRDTQCGFKLLTRAALPHVVPHMHTEGWIFDVELLMLTEAAHIAMREVAVGWKEVPGSKLNVVWDSLAMAWGLAVVRAAWSLGVWRRT